MCGGEGGRRERIHNWGGATGAVGEGGFDGHSGEGAFDAVFFGARVVDEDAVVLEGGVEGALF